MTTPEMGGAAARHPGPLPEPAPQFRHWFALKPWPFNVIAPRPAQALLVMPRPRACAKFATDRHRPKITKGSGPRQQACTCDAERLGREDQVGHGEVLVRLMRGAAVTGSEHYGRCACLRVPGGVGCAPDHAAVRLGAAEVARQAVITRRVPRGSGGPRRRQA